MENKRTVAKIILPLIINPIKPLKVGLTVRLNIERIDIRTKITLTQLLRSLINLTITKVINNIIIDVNINASELFIFKASNTVNAALIHNK